MYCDIERRFCIVEDHLHIELSIWEKSQEKGGQWPEPEVMGAILEPLGKDSLSKLRYCPGVKVLPGKLKEAM